MPTVLHNDGGRGALAKCRKKPTPGDQALVALPQPAWKPGCFGRLADRARESGFLPTPMNGKVPMIRRWNDRPLGKRAIATMLARSPEIANANIGFRTGHLVAIDIDCDDVVASQRIAHVVRGALGETPFVRVGRWPRQMLFYRSIEPISSTPLSKVEILGTGKIATVAGIHPDTGKTYSWPDECLLDVDFSQVPLVDERQIHKLVRWLKDDQDTRKRAYAEVLAREAVAVTASRSASARAERRDLSDPVVEGERNDTLFRRLLAPARTIRSLASLRTLAECENAGFSPPLPDKEVEGIVNSVWSYRTDGTLLVKGRQALVMQIDKDGILQLTPEALYLLSILKSTREGETFTIPQKATAKYLGWGSGRVKKAIDLLVSTGHIRIVTKRIRAQTEFAWRMF